MMAHKYATLLACRSLGTQNEFETKSIVFSIESH